jgi:hypothetical protein
MQPIPDRRRPETGLWRFGERLAGITQPTLAKAVVVGVDEFSPGGDEDKRRLAARLSLERPFANLDVPLQRHAEEGDVFGEVLRRMERF